MKDLVILCFSKAVTDKLSDNEIINIWEQLKDGQPMALIHPLMAKVTERKSTKIIKIFMEGESDA